jgi:hypothetical protein
MGMMFNKLRELPARAIDRWIVGVDLGQSTDPTAIAVMNHRVVPLDTWKESSTTLRQIAPSISTCAICSGCRSAYRTPNKCSALACCCNDHRSTTAASW